MSANRILKWVNYIYLVFPVLIFTLGFVKWHFAIPIGIMICFAFFKATKSDVSSEIKLDRNILLTVLIIIVSNFPPQIRA